MKIIIDYEASWRNSFLDGDNNTPLPKKGRGFIGSMTTLKKEGNFIKREVTLDTVMGLLNRLIGDQRKLYQAREKLYEQQYYFENLESLVTFKDNPTFESNELVYIRNMKGSNDQKSFTGMIKSDDVMFSADYAAEFWGVLALDFDQLCQFIIHGKEVSSTLKADPLNIIARLELLDKEKPVEDIGNAKKVVEMLNEKFPDLITDKLPTPYLESNGKVKPIKVYCAALYIQLDRLSERFDMTSAKTKAGGISGISKRGFTKKNFMGRFTSGKEKKLWGNPYILKERIKGIGEVTSMLKKVSGELEIIIDIDKTKAREIENMIENAGVSSFYLGKKGLAFVSSIRV
ncbi:MAG: type I-Fv CRISPR-associated protein Cas5fv [Colwellia sp.]